jgi:hypothetical protein
MEVGTVFIGGWKIRAGMVVGGLGLVRPGSLHDFRYEEGQKSAGLPLQIWQEDGGMKMTEPYILAPIFLPTFS